MQQVRLLVQEVETSQTTLFQAIEPLLEEIGATLKKYEYRVNRFNYECWQKEDTSIFIVDDSLGGQDYIVIKGAEIGLIVNFFKAKVDLSIRVIEDGDFFFSQSGYHLLQTNKRDWKAFSQEVYLDWSRQSERCLQDFPSKKISELMFTDFDSSRDYVCFIQDLALLSTDYKEEHFTFFKKALNCSEYVRVRLDTLCVLHYVWWDAFKPLILQLSKEDENEFVKELASDFLSYYDTPTRGVFLESNQVPKWWQSCKKYQDKWNDYFSKISYLTLLIARSIGIMPRMLRRLPELTSELLCKEVEAIVKASNLSISESSENNKLVFTPMIKPIILKYIDQAEGNNTD